MSRMMIIPLSLLCVSCASNSGVIKTAPNTYSITVSASNMRGATAGAKRMAYAEANATCDKKGLEIETINEEEKRISFPGPGQVVLDFRCIPKP